MFTLHKYMVFAKALMINYPPFILKNSFLKGGNSEKNKYGISKKKTRFL